MVRVVTENPATDIAENTGIGQRNWDDPDHLALAQLRMSTLFKTVALDPKEPASELLHASPRLDVPAMLFPDPLISGRQLTGEQLLNRRIFNDGLLIMQHGKIVHESYRNGMCAEDHHVIHSCTKSLCAMLVLQAMAQGMFKSADLVGQLLNEFDALPAWSGVTVQHLLDMQAGIYYSEDYQDPGADYWSYARAAGYYPPLVGETAIGVKAWMVKNLVKRAQLPGRQFSYNSCLTNVLGMILERVYCRPLAEIFEQQLYQKVGPEAAALFNTDPQGFPITEGQLNLRLRDFARVAALVLRDGRNLSGEQVVPAGVFNAIAQPNIQARQAYQAGPDDPVFPLAHYKNQFWVLEPEQSRFCMLGIHGQFSWFDLRQSLMIVGVGSYPKQDGPQMMRSLKTLWHGVAAALD